MIGRDVRADRLALLLAIGIAALVHLPFLLGHMPWSHDHPTHLYKAWAFWEQLLTRGQLRGWSHDWFFGYPAEELYPIGPDLWVAAVRLATLGLLDWESTYAVALGLCGVFVAASIQTLGARLVGPWAGLVAAALWSLDLGAVREGGWIYLNLIGVWGQALSTGFFCFGLANLWVALPGGHPRRLAAAGLCFAGALLSHGSATLLLAMLLPILALARGRALASLALPRIAVVGLLAVSLAGFWQIPMMARASWSSDIGELGPPLSLLLLRFLEFGGPFRETHAGIGLLVAVGCVAGLRARVAGVWFLVGATLALLFFSTGTCYQLLHLDGLTSSFAKLQFQRFLIPAKVPWFLLAGCGAVWLGARLRDQLRASRGGERWSPARVGGVILLLAALALLGHGLGQRVETIVTRVYGALDLDGAPAWRAPYQQLAAWTAQRRAEEGAFFRVAVDLGHDDDHRGMALPIWTGVPIYKVGYTPANLYGPGPGAWNARLFQLLSVRWFVTTEDVEVSWLHPVAAFGPMRVFEYGGYRPDRANIEGGGEVETLYVSASGARFRLRDVTPGARLIVHISAWPRWELRQDGAVLPWVAVAPAFGSKESLMSAPAANGEVELRYVALPEDRLGLLASALGLLWVGGLCAPGARFAAARGWFSSRAARHAESWTVALLVLAIIVGLYRQVTAPAEGPFIRPFDNDMTWLPSTFRSM